MFRRGLHSSAKFLERKGVWSDFSKRSKSLGLASESVKKYVFEGDSDVVKRLGPPSLKRRMNRVKYTAPEHIDDMFRISYEFMSKRAEDKYSQLEKETDIKVRCKLETEAELHNPEVLYNFQYNDKLENDTRVIDYQVPVYRHLGLKHWESYGRMLLMQRLESLSVIPDTLPTLQPKAQVSLRFPFSTGVNKWIEPGEILSSNTTSMVPSIKIQEFEHGINFDKQKYTVLIVNPDEPDVLNDSFKTTLAFALTNLKIDYNDNVVDPRKYDESQILADYVPPVPEKNVGKQRYSVWVFRQKSDLESSELIDRENFDIRAFADSHQLEPVGAHVWRSEWDSNVATIREKYGLPEGRVFHRVRRSYV
ncbi:unnamed protein product [Kluyveromyces dobzhanskii CBS 2104]|uniref:Large ribosomal subunit protein mL38 n=1 Tax=Kluyveromyces dobzhanskii CBS 2104 TaxID=1427455 RepID=A0A0A8L6V7_9SACH|nr:unnamed protein product [Kluyveromyces dobzhanskii CBS 2104]